MFYTPDGVGSPGRRCGPGHTSKTLSVSTTTRSPCTRGGRTVSPGHTPRRTSRTPADTDPSGPGDVDVVHPGRADRSSVLSGVDVGTSGRQVPTEEISCRSTDTTATSRVSVTPPVPLSSLPSVVDLLGPVPHLCRTRSSETLVGRRRRGR